MKNVEMIEERGKIILFELLSQILLKLEMFAMRTLDVCYTHLPDWLNCLLKSVDSKSSRISIASIETVLEIIKNADLHPNC